MSEEETIVRLSYQLEELIGAIVENTEQIKLSRTQEAFLVRNMKRL